MESVRFRSYLLIAIITALAAGLFHLSTALAAKSDVFFLHYLGYRAFEPEAAKRALDRQATTAPEQLQELRRRELSARNYPVSTLGHYAGGRLFPDNLALAIAFGLGAPFLTGLAIAVAGLWRLPDMEAPFALTVGVMALAGFLPGPGATDNLAFHGGIDNLLNIFVLAITPGEAFSPLSVWPKSSLALIMMAALANRWSGRITSSYWLLAAAIPFHLTLGGLLLLAFAGMDLALRPERVPPRWSAAALIASLTALGFGQWRIVAEGGLGYAIGTVLAVSVAALFLACANRDRLAVARSTTASDVAAFVLAAALLTPAAMGVVWMAGADKAVSAPEAVFPQLAARLIVLAVTVLLFALAVQAVQWLRRRGAENAAAAAAGLACLMTIYGAAGSWWWESRFLPERLYDTGQRSQTEPLTETYYRALRSLGAGGGSGEDGP